MVADHCTEEEHEVSSKFLEHVGFISLVLQSEEVEDGWRKVTPMLGDFVRGRIALDPSLYETKTEDGVFHVRLSDKGKILAEYI